VWTFVPNCAEFYSLRDLRTVEYVGTRPFNAHPVHIAIDDKTATTPAGQLALLALANQLARAHRRITFGLGTPSIPLAVNVPFATGALGETLLSTVERIDPCGEFRLGAPPNKRVVSLGLGSEVGAGFDWYIGADRAISRLAKLPVGFSNAASTLRGAGLASCLGAAAIFRTMIGLETVPRSVSAWNYLEDTDSSPGPEALQPLDVGRVLMVGAGAVAASLVYWLVPIGIAGDWTIVDRDEVALHNTNRGLVFTPTDAGWPDGSPRRKAELLATFIRGSVSDISWYHESSLVGQDYDVVLGLANDHEVRHLIASRNNTVTLHGTTGANWLSQLHRHITGLDDCIWCRAGEIKAPAFQCSTGEVKVPGGSKTDAALPFLSAASGLMLATALQRLQLGELANQDRNDWRWDFDSTYRMASSSFRRCREGCSRTQPADIRRKINEKCRWRALDEFRME
jgi:ThiF family